MNNSVVLYVPCVRMSVRVSVRVEVCSEQWLTGYSWPLGIAIYRCMPLNKLKYMTMNMSMYNLSVVIKKYIHEFILVTM